MVVVDDDIALGHEAFVAGTPTLFVNGVRVRDATSAEAVSEAIDAALAN